MNLSFKDHFQDTHLFSSICKNVNFTSRQNDTKAGLEVHS